jgi:hypothetical protein
MNKSFHLTLIIIVTLLVTVNTHANDLNIEKVDVFSIHGSKAGQAGIISLDLDNDNKDELVFSSFFNQNWSIQKYNGDEFEIFWQSDSYASDITKLLLIPGSSSNTLVVTTKKGLVELWDLDKLVKINSFSIDQHIFDVDIADANNDGKNDMVVLTSDHLYLYDLNTFEQKHQIDNRGESEAIVIGNVDRDSDNEIIFSDGTVLSSIDNIETVEWFLRDSFPDHYNFGTNLFLIDVNKDSILDLVSSFKTYQATGRNGVGAYDIANKNVAWHIEEVNVTTLTLADVNKDDIPEVIFGINQFGSINVVDIYTQEVLYKINDGTGFYNIHVFDADSDSNMDLIWSGGYSSSSPDYFHIYSLSSETELWKSEDILGFNSISIEDVDGDNNKELIFFSRFNNRQYSGNQGKVFSFSPESLKKKGENPIDTLSETSYKGINDVAIANLDDDPQLEYVIASDYQNQAAIYIVDSSTFQIEMEIILDKYSVVSKILIADVDGDNQLEIIATNQQTSTGSSGVFAYIISPESGDTIWKSVNLLPLWMTEQNISVAFGKGRDIVLTNVDNDNSLELLIAVDELIVIDVETKKIDRLALENREQETDAIVSTIALFDIDQDGKKDIFVGTQSGSIAQVDLEDKSFYLIDTYCKVSQNFGTAKSILELDSIDNGFMAFTCAHNNTVNILNTYNKSVVWSSDVGHLEQRLGLSNGVIKVVDDKNQYTMYVGSANKISQFNIPAQSLVNNSEEKGFSYLPKNDNTQDDIDLISPKSNGSGSINIFLLILIFSGIFRKKSITVDLG